MTHHASDARIERDLFINFGPEPFADRQAAIESCAIDAASDREWFRRNAGKKERHRPASTRECKANALPDGSTVVVMLLKTGAQARLFFGPNDKAVSNPTTSEKK